ncbi:MAG: hypothetical protein K8U57_27865 [Planctomycetes bacterium]|nr:hypothetical protein [Planctomycetota bacterium]
MKIAVLEEQLRGIRQQQKTQAENTEKLFDKLFEEIDKLKAAMNRGRGVFAASLTFAGAIGAGITATLEYLSWGHK